MRYVVFDLLHHGGESLLELPYEQRRVRLLELGLDCAGVVVPGDFTDTPGVLVVTASRETGLGGRGRVTVDVDVSARAAVPGVVKTAVRHTAEVIIAG